MSENGNDNSTQPSTGIPNQKVWWIGGAISLVLLVTMCGEDSDPTSTLAPECQFSDVQPEIDDILSGIQRDINSEVSQVSGCNAFADLLSGNNSEVDTDLILLPEDRSCSYYRSDEAEKYLLDKAQEYRTRADQICGPGLNHRIEVGRNRVEFTEIISSATAGEAARRIGDRMELFAPDLGLRRCLETAGIREEPAVMAQPFNRIVASCEIMLGIPPQRPNVRWLLPSVDDPVPEAIPTEAAGQNSDNATEGNAFAQDVEKNEHSDEPEEYYDVDENGNPIDSEPFHSEGYNEGYNEGYYYVDENGNPIDSEHPNPDG